MHRKRKLQHIRAGSEEGALGLEDQRGPGSAVCVCEEYSLMLCLLWNRSRVIKVQLQSSFRDMLSRDIALFKGLFECVYVCFIEIS